VLANGGVSFFTAAIAAYGVGVLEALNLALIIGFLQGGLAFFLELQREASRDKKGAIGLQAAVLV